MPWKSLSRPRSDRRAARAARPAKPACRAVQLVGEDRVPSGIAHVVWAAVSFPAFPRIHVSGHNPTIALSPHSRQSVRHARAFR